MKGEEKKRSCAFILKVHKANSSETSRSSNNRSGASNIPSELNITNQIHCTNNGTFAAKNKKLHGKDATQHQHNKCYIHTHKNETTSK